LARIKYLSSRQETLSPSDRSGDIFHRFLALVNEKASGSMRIPLYADALNITPHYLSSLVKNVSGKSVMDYNRQAVIQRAKILLRQGFTATQAADDLDFPNLPYFNRFFKRHTGLTPGEYKRQKP
ncbi:MAG: AraC family transcriptional regulator, partial [Bacteroidales bacterium]|nr:AraC family transcriptional regulator [Bacteroidales bacterium]